MTSARIIVSFGILLVQQPWTSISSILPPMPSPFLDDVCRGVECGKGNCKPSRNSTSLFECECDPGWKQTRSHHDNGLKYLPCVIPNCTFHYSCTEGAPPVQEGEIQANKSFFNPCHWSDCGGGWCYKTSPFTYKCECREGHYNLFDVSSFPCFKECAIGADCSSLGINVYNKSSPASNQPDNATNQARSIPRASINLLIIVMVILATVLWK